MEDNNFLARLSADRDMAEIAECAAFTAPLGLVLSPGDIAAVEESRQEALKSSGRVEFSGGIMKKLITAFYTSPYIQSSSYAQTLCELQEQFYYLKNASGDRLSDDELLEAMRKIFDGPGGGDAEHTGESLEASL